MDPRKQKFIYHVLGYLRLAHEHAKGVGFVPVTDSIDKSIMNSISGNKRFPIRNSTVTFYITPAILHEVWEDHTFHGGHILTSDQGYPDMAAISAIMGFYERINVNIAWFPGSKSVSEFPASIGNEPWKSLGFNKFVEMNIATGLPKGTLLKYGGKKVEMSGQLKDSIAKFCNSPNGKFGSLNEQNIVGIGKLEEGKPLVIATHSLGTALSMPFLYQALASGKFPRIIVVTAGGYCSTDDVAAKQLQELGVEIYNLQILGDPITEWAKFESEGYAVLPGKVLRARYSTNLWFNPFALHNLGLYHATVQGDVARFYDITNGGEYPEVKAWPADVSLEAFLANKDYIALEWEK